VPADGSTGRVFRHDSFHDVLWLDVGPGRGTILQRFKEGGDRPGLAGAAGAEVVFESVFHDAALGDVTVEIEWLEFEAADLFEQLLLFLRVMNSL